MGTSGFLGFICYRCFHVAGGVKCGCESDDGGGRGEFSVDEDRSVCLLNVVIGSRRATLDAEGMC